MLYDVVIIGADIAGLTAGIYAGRKKMNAIIVSKTIGGQSIYAGAIENYPAIDVIPGAVFVTNAKNQVKKFGVPIEDGEQVLSLSKNGENFIVKTQNKEYVGKAVIVATGKSPRKIGIPGEDKFFGKGVGICAICDAPFYTNKDVAVVGGGNSAFDSAYDLLSYAQKIYVLQYKDKFVGDESMYEKLKASGKVEFLVNALTKEITGDSQVDGLVYEDTKTKETKKLDISGVFVNIGQSPNTSFAENFLELNERKEIKINSKTGETSVKGIFAAGDVTDCPHKQAVIAAGAGAVALLSAFEYLKRRD
jgi:thioredoxin-disulfide reductase